MPSTERRLCQKEQEENQIVEHFIYRITLLIQLKRDGRQWIARCPAISVATQSPTKKRVMKEIQEAVEGWFEYCIEEDVLEKALKEAGFKEVLPASSDFFSSASNRIVKEIFKEENPPTSPRFTLAHDNWSNNYVQGLIPSAHFASSQLREGEVLAHI